MSKKRQFSNLQEVLTPAVFYILLAINIRELHGYEIMKQVRVDSNGKLELGPGTLYTAIKRMLDANLIEEVSGKSDDPRRRYYKLTEKGHTMLSSELSRFQDALVLAEKRKLVSKITLSKSLFDLSLELSS